MSDTQQQIPPTMPCTVTITRPAQWWQQVLEVLDKVPMPHFISGVLINEIYGQIMQQQRQPAPEPEHIARARANGGVGQMPERAQ
jgi:glucokinase